MDIFNWTFKDDIIYEYADKECNRICHAAIKQLQALGTDHIGTLIDDQCCKNVWNILCVSMQDYPTSDMWLYESYGGDIIAKLVAPLPEYIKMAIWWKYVLYSGDSHLDNNDCIYEDNDCIYKGKNIVNFKGFPYCEDEIIAYIWNEYVLSTACNYTNSVIRWQLEARGAL